MIIQKNEICFFHVSENVERQGLGENGFYIKKYDYSKQKHLKYVVFNMQIFINVAKKANLKFFNRRKKQQVKKS